MNFQNCLWVFIRKEINKMENLEMIKPKRIQNIINKFCYTIGMIPTSYKMSLTYEEQIIAIGHYLETTVYPAINNNAEALA